MSIGVLPSKRDAQIAAAMAGERTAAGQFRSLQGKAAQSLHEGVGECRPHHAQPVGVSRMAAGPLAEQIQLRLFDAVLRFAALAVQTVVGRTTTERHYYISSLGADAPKIAHAIRSHWEIENRLHWCLDVQFGDDYARAREGYAANNLAVVRHIALNLIRLDTSRKTSIKTKRLLAAGSDKFRSALLGL